MAGSRAAGAAGGAAAAAAAAAGAAAAANLLLDGPFPQLCSSYTIEVEIHDGPYNVISNW